MNAEPEVQLLLLQIQELDAERGRLTHQRLSSAWIFEQQESHRQGGQ